MHTPFILAAIVAVAKAIPQGVTSQLWASNHHIRTGCTPSYGDVFVIEVVATGGL